LRDDLHVAVAVNVHDQDDDQVNHDVARRIGKSPKMIHEDVMNRQPCPYTIRS
jgi:hypothetical protein